MVQSKRRLLYIREKNRSHKTKNPLFHFLPCHEMLKIIVVLKNGAALIFANFFQHCTAAEFVEITRTRPDHLPCQPTLAAELLLDGCKIEPYTIVIMGHTFAFKMSPQSSVRAASE
jgi:hypothetical protein